MPSVSAVRPVQELVGFQNPLTLNVAPVTVMTAPPPVTVPLHFFDASFNVNLSPPGVPRRVSFGEKVAFPVTFLHDTLPAAVMAEGANLSRRRAVAPPELGIASAPARVTNQGRRPQQFNRPSHDRPTSHCPLQALIELPGRRTVPKPGGLAAELLHRRWETLGSERPAVYPPLRIELRRERRDELLDCANPPGNRSWKANRRRTRPRQWTDEHPTGPRRRRSRPAG